MIVGHKGNRCVHHGPTGKCYDSLECCIFDGLVQLNQVLLQFLLGGRYFGNIGSFLLANLSLVENFLFVLLYFPKAVDKGGLFERSFLEAGDALFDQEEGFTEMLICLYLASDGFGLPGLFDQFFGGDHCGVGIVERFVERGVTVQLRDELLFFGLGDGHVQFFEFVLKLSLVNLQILLLFGEGFGCGLLGFALDGVLILTDSDQFFAGHLQAVQFRGFGIRLQSALDVLQRFECLFLDLNGMQDSLDFDLASGVQKFRIELITIHDGQGAGEAESIERFFGFLLCNGKVFAETLDGHGDLELAFGHIPEAGGAFAAQQLFADKLALCVNVFLIADDVANLVEQLGGLLQ